MTNDIVLNNALMEASSTKNSKVLNPATNTLVFGKIPVNPTGIPSGLIYLRLGFIGQGPTRKGAFGARHIWDKHKTDLSIATPEDLPRVLSEILVEGVNVLYEDKSKPVILNTEKGLVSLGFKKNFDGSVEYSIITAYGRRDSRGVVFAKLENA